MSSVITKNGDQGTTKLIGGREVLKNSPIICLLGDLDKVNASIGYLLSILNEKQYILGLKTGVLTTLQWIQDGLYNMSIEIASSYEKIYIGKREVERLETEALGMESVIPHQKSFIHYRGVKAAMYAQVIRADVRQAERSYISFINSLPSLLVHAELGGINCIESYVFVNRLSDYFFILSRYLNHKFGYKETKVVKWEAKRKDKKVNE